MKKIISIADFDRKNVMLYDAVAKEVFFARGALFLEGPEDANILRLTFRETSCLILKFLDTDLAEHRKL